MVNVPSVGENAYVVESRVFDISMNGVTGSQKAPLGSIASCLVAGFADAGGAANQNAEP